MSRPRIKMFRGTPGLRRFYRNHKNRILYSGYFGKKKRP